MKPPHVTQVAQIHREAQTVALCARPEARPPSLALSLAGALAMAALILLAAPLRAETPPAQDHSKMEHATMDHGAAMGEAPPQGSAAEAFAKINAEMHHAMAVDFTGDADRDFIRSMIPHHQGAVAMAEVTLKEGSDPEVRKLAEEIIAAQKSEIAWMEDWLASHPAE